MGKLIRIAAVLAVTACLAVGTVGCKKEESPAEKVEEAVEDAGDAAEDAADETADAVEEATE